MRILLDILLVDNKIDAREIDLFNRVNEKLQLPEEMLKEVREQNSLLALSQIRDFSSEQKEEFAKLMGRMIVADENIHYQEVVIYNAVRDFCHIDMELEDTFSTADYPDLTVTEEPDFEYEYKPEK